MRVIHQHIVRLAFLNPLHASGHTSKTLQAGGDDHWVAPESVTRGKSREQIAQVVAADERTLDGDQTFRPDELERSALETEHHFFGPHQRGGRLAKRDHLQMLRHLGRETAAVSIIDIDGRDAGRCADGTVKEPALHLKIFLKRLVVVEVVAGEIGEDRDAKLHAEHALLVDAV